MKRQGIEYKTMNDLTLYNQTKGLLTDFATEIKERDEVIDIQARRIVELEEQLDSATRINKMLMEKYQQKAAETRALYQNTDYTVGQEVAFCVKYSTNEKWYEGIVLYVGKTKIKIRYKNERGVMWREPRFVRPIEDAPKHQGSTPYRIEGEAR